MSEKPISAEFPFESKFLEVRGSKIHYIDEGEGDPIVFIHGNPTSSYLWRNIIPYLVPYGRCIALDLIGMGKSDKPDINYGFHDSYAYVEEFLNKLNLKNITLVLHDWGSGMGFHFANNNRDKIKAIAFMEAMVNAPRFENFPLGIKMAIGMMRNPVMGYLMGQVGNMFIKKMLPDMINRKLTREEMRVYAEPYPTIKSRKSVKEWPAYVPIKGQPADVAEFQKSWSRYLKESEIPKLCFYVLPGVGFQKDDVKDVRENMKNVEMIELGEGTHFLQEDYPHEVGEALVEWYKKSG